MFLIGIIWYMRHNARAERNQKFLRIYSILCRDLTPEELARGAAYLDHHVYRRLQDEAVMMSLRLEGYPADDLKKMMDKHFAKRKVEM
ncbi:MAG: hypothetical protein K6V73_08290 [Firmicutes bacterium]|nr:hypothetical protein [Bacillota bacterium]